jgi:hypothetical protein
MMVTSPYVTAALPPRVWCDRSGLRALSVVADHDACRGHADARADREVESDAAAAESNATATYGDGCTADCHRRSSNRHRRASDGHCHGVTDHRPNPGGHRRASAQPTT